MLKQKIGTDTNVADIFSKRKATREYTYPVASPDVPWYTDYETIVALEQFYKKLQQLALTKEGEENMDWQEKYIDKLSSDINDIKNSLRDTENRIAQMIKQTLGEIRDRDNQRHQEFLAINAKLDQKIESIEQKIDIVRNEIKEDRKWIMGIALSTIIGIAAMVITVYVALFKK
ncbi:MAG: hypothetical protein L5655_09370 [Thermosediminibacteraceae bacterium]|nr:hypothetical protein [Thermosediminibacteraceae bacterium]